MNAKTELILPPPVSAAPVIQDVRAAITRVYNEGLLSDDAVRVANTLDDNGYLMFTAGSLVRSKDIADRLNDLGTKWARLQLPGAKVRAWDNRKKVWKPFEHIPTTEMDAWVKPGMVLVREAVRFCDGSEGPMGHDTRKIRSIKVGGEIRQGIVKDKRMFDGKVEYLVKPHSKARQKEIAAQEDIQAREAELLHSRDHMDPEDIEVATAAIEAAKLIAQQAARPRRAKHP